MTKSVLQAHPNAGVWIDHRRAQIVGLTPDGAVTTVILSNVEKHPERTGDSPMTGPYEASQVPADDRRQRTLTGQLNGYYDNVIGALSNYGALLLLGPGEAKLELHARLLTANLGGRVSAIETQDRMTERQVIARVRAYFGVSAPRVQGAR